MNQRVSKLIKSVYPPNMVNRIKGVYKNLSYEGKTKAIKEMKKNKQDIKEKFSVAKDQPISNFVKS